MGARITVQPQTRMKKKFRVDANYTPNPHPLILEERTCQFEVYANGLLEHREILCECVGDMEKKIVWSTSRALPSALHIIAHLEEKVDVLQTRIIVLGATNEQLCQSHAHHLAPVKEENLSTTN